MLYNNYNQSLIQGLEIALQKIYITEFELIFEIMHFLILQTSQKSNFGMWPYKSIKILEIVRSSRRHCLQLLLEFEL